MPKYILVFKQAVINYLVYPFDFFLHTFKYAVTVSLMALIWLAVQQENTALNFSRTDIVSYYILAAIIYGVSNFHTEYVEFDIKLGYLTRLLIKPISAFWYYFFFQTGSTMLEILFKVLAFAPIIWWLNITFSFSLINLSLVTMYLLLSFLLAFCVFFMTSSLSFWFQDVWSIRFSVMFMMRFLSGVFVPLTFFPAWYQNLSHWLPFQYMTFTPIQLVQGHVSVQQGIQGLVILSVWTGVIFLCKTWFWSRASREYEGTGI